MIMSIWNGASLEQRVVCSELLDALPADDPGAVRSRRDLRRLNAVIRHPFHLAGALKPLLPRGRPVRLTDIGAGDGCVTLDVARRLGKRCGPAEITLVDRKPAALPRMEARFAALNWRARFVRADALDWLSSIDSVEDAISVNLFLHHLNNAELRALFGRIASGTRAFVALEPRRSRISLFLSKCVRLAGCGSVTAHDAPISVRAGFRGNELSALWPEVPGWRLAERQVGLFSHLFMAERESCFAE
jgi:SAM-dependent methyltransferase